MSINDSVARLQRIGHPPPPIIPGRLTHPRVRAALRVRGIGKLDKHERDSGRSPHPTTQPHSLSPEERPTASRQRSSMHIATEDMLVGLSSYQVPVAFELTSDGTSTSVTLGTWYGPGATDDDATKALGMLKATLRSLFLAVDVGPAPYNPSHWTHTGLALGLPTVQPSDSSSPELPIDRLIRAMRGRPWGCTVVAQPLTKEVIRRIHAEVIGDIRVVSAATATRGPTPLEQHYVELLTQVAESLFEAESIGGWRTGVYLSGTNDSFYELASVWRAVFAGTDSSVEPVQIFELDGLGDYAGHWALPDPVSSSRHEGFAHRFTHQSLLTSAQLASFVHLPSVETAGFQIDTVPVFDAVPQQLDGDAAIELGAVIEPSDLSRPNAKVTASGAPVSVTTALLTRHVFVTGLTGEGKTTTVKRLLVEAWRTGVPFLVVEPAKHEYRELLRDPEVGPHLRIFTPALETGSPLRLNPFEVLDKIPVSVHLDLLRSAFNASFGMWTPLPQVLEMCLQQVYVDRGWDLTCGGNYRGDIDDPMTFPRMGELVAKVDPVVASLGYDAKIADDIRAALTTRLRGLSRGAKGRLFDVQASTSQSALLQVPTVIELESIGDDDDKAFIISLLMIRLAEYWRSQGQAHNQLRHLLVIEEAHRLLANVAPNRDETQSDPRGKAVETFADLLAEIRAYGQGVVVVDQSATKLAPDVIRNSNLKLAHRVVDGADREVIAKSMVMNDRQERALATIPRGTAAMFLSGEDAPLHVKIRPLDGDAAEAPPEHPADGGDNPRPPTIDEIRVTMEQRLPPGMITPKAGACELGCPSPLSACAAADDALADRILQTRVARAYSTLETAGPAALPAAWRTVEARAATLRPANVGDDDLRVSIALHAAHWITHRRGAQRGWTYAATSADEAIVGSLFYGCARGEPLPGERGPLLASPQRPPIGAGPFERCTDLWPQGCPCREVVSDLVAVGVLLHTWKIQTLAERADLCRSIAREAVGAADADTTTRIALCAGQQLIQRCTVFEDDDHDQLTEISRHLHQEADHE
jgi:hypothetical protein